MRIVATVSLKYKDKTYIFDYDFGEDYSVEGAEFMFEDGNYSCDCNRSMFIKRYCDKNFEEMDCGEEIELVNLRVKKI